ncbi:MAG: hypothetical protein MUF28_15875 [Ignavibacterium sp.]|jgi:hypothetical protein|nr:hypothetical protein [Ignavibacterium sp.]
MNKIITILVYLIFANIVSADPNDLGGELLIKFLPGTNQGTFSVSVSSADPDNYSWHWENNTVVLDNSFFSHSVSDKTVYTFGSPKTEIGHGDYRISWGLFTFIIITNTGLSRTFKLDLRDEKWAEFPRLSRSYRDSGMNLPNHFFFSFIQKYQTYLSVNYTFIIFHLLKLNIDVKF